MKWKLFSLIGVLAFLLFMVGCASDDEGSGNNGGTNGNESETNSSDANNTNDDDVANNVTADEDVEDVTIRVRLDPWGTFEEEWVARAEEQFPHITIEMVHGDMQDLIAAQTVPDILWYWDDGWLNETKDFELGLDLTELVDQFNFDMTRYDEGHIQEWNKRADGELWALPMSRDPVTLNYNPAIFDLFGVPYPDPEEPMTWDEVYDLAVELTAEEGGVQYQGLYLPRSTMPITEQVPHLVDPDTHEPLWPNDEWVRRYFELYERVYSIPGNDWIAEHWMEDSWVDKIEGDQVLAMAPTWRHVPEEGSGLDLDYAPFPVWEEYPNVGPGAGGWAMGISSASDYPEEAFRLIDFWLSDEQIMNQTFAGSGVNVPFPHLYEDGSVEEQLRENNDPLLEKNLDALFALETASAPERVSPYENHDVFGEALQQYVTEYDGDLNSFLQEKYEEELVRIEEEIMLD